MSESKRKIFTGAQKAKVALEAVKGTKTVNEIAQEYGYFCLSWMFVRLIASHLV